jgi:hypothetical protein
VPPTRWKYGIPLADPERVRVLLEADDRERRSSRIRSAGSFLSAGTSWFAGTDRVRWHRSGHLSNRHDRGVRFFDFRSAKRNELSRGILAIEQEKKTATPARRFVSPSRAKRFFNSSEIRTMVDVRPRVDGHRGGGSHRRLKKEFAFAAALSVCSTRERFGGLDGW